MRWRSRCSATEGVSTADPGSRCSARGAATKSGPGATSSNRTASALDRSGTIPKGFASMSSSRSNDSLSCRRRRFSAAFVPCEVVSYKVDMRGKHLAWLLERIDRQRTYYIVALKLHQYFVRTRLPIRP
jgi:hypothetical protein